MRVVIAGRYATYDGPFDDVEVWGVNHCAQRQKNLSRIYVMDHLDFWARDRAAFAAELNQANVPVVMQRHFADIPLSEAYPLRAVMRATLGTDDLNRAYFTSSIAYMIADAIYKGATEITLHRILCLPPAIDYFMQKGCFEFWVGLAHGRGIQVRISEDSNILKATPWDSHLYGYIVPDNETGKRIMASAARAAIAVPIKFREAAEVYGGAQH